uniref:Nucleoredoxin n=1 Tax=Solanum tuberosum TaxID=4113 RepID=M1D251_SOLTU
MPWLALPFGDERMQSPFPKFVAYQQDRYGHSIVKSVALIRTQNVLEKKKDNNMDPEV